MNDLELSQCFVLFDEFVLILAITTGRRVRWNIQNTAVSSILTEFFHQEPLPINLHDFSATKRVRSKLHKSIIKKYAFQGFQELSFMCSNSCGNFYSQNHSSKFASIFLFFLLVWSECQAGNSLLYHILNTRMSSVLLCFRSNQFRSSIKAYIRGNTDWRNS